MALAAHRWMTTAPNAPFVRAAFAAARSKPLGEPHRLDDIHRIREAVHRRTIDRRAVLVP